MKAFPLHFSIKYSITFKTLSYNTAYTRGMIYLSKATSSTAKFTQDKKEWEEPAEFVPPLYIIYKVIWRTLPYVSIIHMCAVTALHFN